MVANILTGTIVVDDKGTKLFYRDSGVPETNQASYTTVFIWHGIHYNSCKCLAYSSAIPCLPPLVRYPYQDLTQFF